MPVQRIPDMSVDRSGSRAGKMKLLKCVENANLSATPQKMVVPNLRCGLLAVDDIERRLGLIQEVSEVITTTESDRTAWRQLLNDIDDRKIVDARLNPDRAECPSAK